MSRVSIVENFDNLELENLMNREVWRNFPKVKEKIKNNTSIDPTW